MRALLRKALALWMRVTAPIGHFMSRLILTVFYFLIVAPFAIGVRLLSDPLGLRRKPGSYWLSRTSRTDPTDIETFRKQ